MIYAHLKPPNDKAKEDQEQMDYLRRWSQLSERERRREAILEWVAIISTFAAFVAVVLALIVLIGV